MAVSVLRQALIEAESVADLGHCPACRRLARVVRMLVDDLELMQREAMDAVDDDLPTPKPQHALVVIGSSGDTLFVRDLGTEAVFKIPAVRV